MKPHHVIITVVIGMSLIAFAPMSKSTEPAGNPPTDATKPPPAQTAKSVAPKRMTITLPRNGYDGASLLQPIAKRPLRRVSIDDPTGTPQDTNN